MGDHLAAGKAILNMIGDSANTLAAVKTSVDEIKGAVGTIGEVANESDSDLGRE